MRGVRAHTHDHVSDTMQNKWQGMAWHGIDVQEHARVFNEH